MDSRRGGRRRRDRSAVAGVKRRTEWEKFPEGVKTVIGIIAALTICVIFILLEVTAR